MGSKIVIVGDSVSVAKLFGLELFTHNEWSKVDQAIDDYGMARIELNPNTPESDKEMCGRFILAFKIQSEEGFSVRFSYKEDLPVLAKCKPTSSDHVMGDFYSEPCITIQLVDSNSYEQSGFASYIFEKWKTGDPFYRRYLLELTSEGMRLS